MKTEIITRVSITEDEEETLRGAEGILREICQYFTDKDTCEQCPINDMCKKLGFPMTPQTFLSNITDSLDVEIP